MEQMDPASPNNLGGWVLASLNDVFLRLPSISYSLSFGDLLYDSGSICLGYNRPDVGAHSFPYHYLELGFYTGRSPVCSYTVTCLPYAHISGSRAVRILTPSETGSG